MRLPVPLASKSDKAAYPGESVERLVNCYVERVPEGKEPIPIFGTPGMTEWASGLAGALQAGLALDDVAYYVAGGVLYQRTEAGAQTALGVVPYGGLASMATDGTNVVVVADGLIYVWNGTTFAQVTDPDAPQASWVEYVDGFFVFGERDTEQWFISALRDPTSYDALDFASAEWKPDKLVRPFKYRDTLYLAGTRTFEAQQNTGAADFPFSAYRDLKIDVGLAGAWALCATNDAVFWLAHDLTIRRLDGITATVISTPAVGRIIRAWSDPSLTVASAHVWDHHLFIVFRNPEGCVVFDQAMERWHERQSQAMDTWRARVSFEAFGKVLFGAPDAGTIYALDDEALDEAGEVIPREVVTPYAYVANRRLTVSELEVVCQVGVGSPTLDPEMLCERTKDGRVWSGAKRRRLGKAGQTLKRVRFGAQGQSRAFAWRLRMSDRAKFALFGAYAEADAEAA